MIENTFKNIVIFLFCFTSFCLLSACQNQQLQSTQIPLPTFVPTADLPLLVTQTNIQPTFTPYSEILPQIISDGSNNLLPSVTNTTTPITQNDINKDYLIYLSEEKTVIILDIQTNEQIFQSEGGVNYFSLSPSNRYFAYLIGSSDWYVMEIVQQDNNLQLQLLSGLNIDWQGSLDTLYQSGVIWSPNNQYITFIYPSGYHRTFDIYGNEFALANNILYLSWSFDSQWISYCTDDLALWVINLTEQMPILVNETACQQSIVKPFYVDWNPTKLLLAYSIPRANPNEAITLTGVTYFYDPTTQEKTFIYDGLIIDWSENGVYLALISTANVGVTGGVAGEVVVIGEAVEYRLDTFFFERNAGINNWVASKDFQVFRNFKIESLNVSKIANVVFAYSSEGSNLLIGHSANGTPSIACHNLESNSTQDIFQIVQGNLFGAMLPGIWAGMSANGKYAVLSFYYETSGGFDHKTVFIDCELNKVLVEQPVLAYHIEFSPSQKFVALEETNSIALFEANGLINKFNLRGQYAHWLVFDEP